MAFGSATIIGSGSPSRILPRIVINAAPETWFAVHTSREPKPPTSSTLRRWRTIWRGAIRR